MKYTNTQQFNSGLKLMTRDPADDRLVLSSSANMFVNKNNTANSSLYGRAYAGMIVTVEDEGYESYVCINDAPYQAKTVANVSAGNLATYWKRGDLTLYNYVHTEVDNYVRTPHIKVNSEWIACTSTLSTTGIKGIDYVFNASIDNNTLKVHNSILSGWKFKLDKLETPTSDKNYVEYQLQYWAPGATSWANDPTKIEIPKLQVLKSVRLCVAVPDTTAMGGYTVATVKIGSENVEVYRDDSRIDEATWQKAAADAAAQRGGVFLRIEWDNDKQDPPTAITYINVGEIITIDIEPLRVRLSSLESSTYALESSVNVLESSVNALESRARILDVSVNSLETRATRSESSIGNINSSIAALKANDTSIINYINNDVSVKLHADIDEVSAYIINTVIGSGASISQQIANINSSISDVSNRVASNYSTLSSSIGQTYTKLTDVSNRVASNYSTLSSSIGQTYTKLTDVSNRVASNYSTLSSSIGQTYTKLTDVSNRVASNYSTLSSSIGLTYTSLNNVITNEVTTAIARVNVELADVSNRVASNYSTLSSSIGLTYTSLNDVITNEVTTAIARVDLELADVSSRVENNYETLSTAISNTNFHLDASIQQLTTRLDSSLLEMVDFIYENTQVFAASWAMFKENNPHLNWNDFPYLI